MLRVFSATTPHAGPEAGSDSLTLQTPAAGQDWRRRRGTTAMEYLIAASFILVVVILAVQHLGDITRALFSESVNATKTNQNTTP